MVKRKELLAIGIQYRKLTRTRYKAIKAAAIADKMTVRTTFNASEIDLIDQRFILKHKMLEHHYAARNDSGSIAHCIAQQNNSNEHNFTLAGVDSRGHSLATITANKKARSKEVIAKKRAAIKAIKVDKTTKQNEKIPKITKKIRIAKVAKTTA